MLDGTLGFQGCHSIRLPCRWAPTSLTLSDDNPESQWVGVCLQRHSTKQSCRFSKVPSHLERRRKVSEQSKKGNQRENNRDPTDKGTNCSNGESSKSVSDLPPKPRLSSLSLRGLKTAHLLVPRQVATLRAEQRVILRMRT